MAALGEQLWLNKAITGRKQQPFNWKELKRTLEYLGTTRNWRNWDECFIGQVSMKTKLHSVLEFLL